MFQSKGNIESALKQHWTIFFLDVLLLTRINQLEHDVKFKEEFWGICV